MIFGLWDLCTFNRSMQYVSSYISQSHPLTRSDRSHVSNILMMIYILVGLYRILIKINHHNLLVFESSDKACLKYKVRSQWRLGSITDAHIHFTIFLDFLRIRLSTIVPRLDKTQHIYRYRDKARKRDRYRQTNTHTQR